jgi:ESCRT-II complex subunit VPS22
MLNRANMMKKKKQVIQQQNKEINAEQNQKLTEQLASFTKNLENFAQKYKNEIQFNPDFREQFYTMCLEIGVDPLASISLWSKTLNLSEFYYNLAIQIITISMTKGPLIEINELRKILMNNMKTTDISIMDIEKAIESVSELKCGFQIVTVKNSKAVVTVPMEKDAAVDDIIKMASENDGWIGYSICYNKKGMKQIEFENAIKTLLNHGVAWEDRQNFIKNQTKNDNVIYWFPGLNNK